MQDIEKTRGELWAELQELRRTTERSRHLLSLTDTLYHSSSRTLLEPFRLDWVGGAPEAVTGFTAAEHSLNGRWIQIVHPDDRQHLVHLLQDIQPGQSGQLELRILHKDGRTIWVRDSYRCESGPDQTIVFFGAMVDITRSRQAEKDLHDESNWRRTLMNISEDGIAIINSAHEVIEANARFAAMLGYTPEEVLRLRTWDYEGVLSEEQIRRNFADLAQVKTIIESRHRRKDGSTFPVEMSLSGTVIDGRSILLAVCRDISQRKQMEDHLREARLRAEQSSQVKSEFLANMSHELRTPLNGISGMLQLLKTTELDSEQAEYVDTGLTVLSKLTTIINDILDLSKIEAGKIDIREAACSLRAICQSLQAIFQPMLRPGVDLAFTVSASVPDTIRGDESRIRQVLFNLVGNAIKFTESGSIAVTIDAEPRTDKPGRCMISMDVTDTGIGIPADLLEILFNPFTQGETLMTKKHQGTGLGLSIVKRLLELMHGSVSLTSEEGGGTTVLARFEAGTGDHSARVRPDAPPDEPACTLESVTRILLVEDDITSQTMIRRMLEKAGATVACAENGIEAISLLHSTTFDLVLMDIQMPVMDGLITTSRIRSSNLPQADIPIIAVTAFSMRGDRERFQAAGMNDYIAKPISLDRLCRIIRRLLHT